MKWSPPQAETSRILKTSRHPNPQRQINQYIFITLYPCFITPYRHSNILANMRIYIYYSRSSGERKTGSSVELPVCNEVVMCRMSVIASTGSWPVPRALVVRSRPLFLLWHQRTHLPLPYSFSGD